MLELEYDSGIDFFYLLNKTTINIVNADRSNPLILR